MLLAGVNSKTQLYKWSPGGGGGSDGVAELKSVCGHHGHILALYIRSHGDFIVVGDLMKSVSLLVYKPLENTIDEIARDYNAMWMTSIAILDDDTYIGCDNSYNLFTVSERSCPLALKSGNQRRTNPVVLTCLALFPTRLPRILIPEQLCKNSDAIDEESRGRLELKGEFHLGDMVNCIRKGSLVMQNTQSSFSLSSPSTSGALSAAEDVVSGIQGELVFGTVSGRLGVIARINGAQYRFLLRLQNAIAQVVPRVGQLSYREWRSFHNERRSISSSSKPLNFIDGDMIERFLDLDRKSMEKVVGLVNKSITVATGVAKMKKGTGSGQEGDSANTSAAAKGKDIDGKTPRRCRCWGRKSVSPRLSGRVDSNCRGFEQDPLGGGVEIIESKMGT